MRAILTFALSLCCASPVLAQTVHHSSTTQAHAPAAKPGAKPAAKPKQIGVFEDWAAATHQEGGQTACYAFTRASASTPALAGRGDVVLTVTQRPSTRDSVALSAGFAYATGAAVSVAIDKTTLDFYTAARSAFARDGHAAVQAFLHGAKAIATSPGPREANVTDNFSLRGFDAAYAAINKACPAK